MIEWSAWRDIVHYGHISKLNSVNGDEVCQPFTSTILNSKLSITLRTVVSSTKVLKRPLSVD